MSSRPITATAGDIFYTVRRRRGPLSARKAHNVTPVADLDFVIGDYQAIPGFPGSGPRDGRRRHLALNQGHAFRVVIT